MIIVIKHNCKYIDNNSNTTNNNHNSNTINNTNY